MDTEHKAHAAASYNSCWKLIDDSPRTADNDAALLTNAFASRYHWSQIGVTQNMIIADWMVSRAAAVTGYGDMAVTFATRANDATTSESPDWLVASCAEGLARAYQAAGNSGAQREWTQTAEKLVAAIADDEDRKIIADQLSDLLN